MVLKVLSEKVIFFNIERFTKLSYHNEQAYLLKLRTLIEKICFFRLK